MKDKRYKSIYIYRSLTKTIHIHTFVDDGVSNFSKYNKDYETYTFLLFIYRESEAINFHLLISLKDRRIVANNVV